VAWLCAPELNGRGAIEDRRKVAERLAHSLESHGLVPPPGARDFRVPFARTPQREPGENVLAWLPGTEAAEHVIVSAHYDGRGRAAGVLLPGADDDATGVAAVLEVARSLAAGPRPRRSATSRSPGSRGAARTSRRRPCRSSAAPPS
jgi:hypothetical protein